MGPTMSNLNTPMPSAASSSGGLFVRVKDGLSALKDLELWRLVMVFVSGLTTFIGMVLLYDSLGSGHGNALIGSLRYVIPPALAGTIHAIIYWTLERGATLRRYRFFLLAIPFQLVAIFGSFGAHWTHMRGDSHTVGDFEKSQTAIVRGIQNFVQSYQTMASASSALAQHSIVQAKNEADGPGDSCGAVAGTGRGPRFDLRMSDRDTFSGFNREVAAKVKQLEALAGRAETITAASVAEAMRQRTELRRIVNEAKMFETDPLLGQLRQSAQQRLQKGRSAIAMPPQKRGKGGAASFTCPDPVLERHLSAVIDAIAGLKPVPEAEFKNASDVRVGATLAWQRLMNSVFGGQILVLRRDEQRDARQQQLRGNGEAVEKLSGEDIGPLAVALAVEFGLTLLFLFGGGALPSHPGLAELQELVGRRREQVFDKMWTALGGDEARGAVRRVLSRFTKFEDKSALVIVPVYSEDSAVQSLHQLMHVLCHVNLAKCIYTGQYMKGFFGFGWSEVRRADALAHGAVRVYRMTAVDYLALILDAVHGAGNEQAPSAGHGAENVLSVPKVIPSRSTDGKKAA